MTAPIVRRIRSDEWQAVRELRLESTSDPDANIAFLETPEQVAARPEQFWRDRAQLAAESETAAQFVAVVDDVWVGSVSVLVRASGQTDHLGRFVDDRRADVVGVYVNPAHRPRAHPAQPRRPSGEPPRASGLSPGRVRADGRVLHERDRP